MSERITILLADDHALFRRGVAELLAARPEFELVGEAAGGPQAARLAEQIRPDVVVMDVHMPGGGSEAVRQLKRKSGARVLMLTVSSKDEDLLGAIRAGADGYLLKNAEPEELFQAIQRVAEGQGALSPEVTTQVMRQAARGGTRPTSVALSPREHEVLRHLAQGATTDEVAAALVLSASTVKTYVRHLLNKLEAANRTEAVARAAALGLLDEP